MQPYFDLFTSLMLYLHRCCASDKVPDIDFNSRSATTKKQGLLNCTIYLKFNTVHNNSMSFSNQSFKLAFNMKLKHNDYTFFSVHNNMYMKKLFNRFFAGSFKRRLSHWSPNEWKLCH